MEWYQMNPGQALESFSTSEGLSEQEARRRLETYGPNKLAECEELSRLKILLHHA